LDGQLSKPGAEMMRYPTTLEPGDQSIPAADTIPPARESGDTADLEAISDTLQTFARAVPACTITLVWGSGKPNCW
jgi:hypothetical protein